MTMIGETCMEDLAAYGPRFPHQGKFDIRLVNSCTGHPAHVRVELVEEASC